MRCKNNIERRFIRKSVISKDQTVDDLRIELQLINGKIEETSFKNERYVNEEILKLKKEIEVLRSDIQKLREYIANAMKQNTEVKPSGISKQTMRELYNNGYKFFANKKYQKALSHFEVLLKRFPKTHYKENAQFFLAGSYFNLERFEEAIIAYEEIVKSFPNSKRLAQINLKQAISFKNIKADDDARYFFNQVISKYPKSSEAKVALKELAGMKKK